MNCSLKHLLFLLIYLPTWSASASTIQDGLNKEDETTTSKAAVRVNEQLAYLFDANEVTRLEINDGQVTVGNRYTIQEEFLSLPFTQVDAATQVSPEHLLFFSEDSMALYNILHDSLIMGFPKSVKDEWPSIKSDKILSAFQLDKQRICLLHEDDFSIVSIDLKHISHYYFFPSMWSLYSIHGSSKSKTEAAMNWNGETAYFFSHNSFSKFNVLGPGFIGDNTPISENFGNLTSQLSQSSGLLDSDRINIYSFDHLKGEHRIHGYVQGLKDPRDEYGYEEVSKAPLANQFVKAEDWVIENAEGNGPILDSYNWSRFSLKNTSDVSMDVALSYNNSLGNDSLRVYIKNEAGNVTFYRFGTGVSKSQMKLGDIPSNAAYGWGKSIYFPIGPNEELEVYSKIYSSGWLGTTTAWPIYMYGISTRANQVLRSSALDNRIIIPRLFLFGLIMMLALYAFLIFIMNRDVTSLYLCVFIIATSYIAAFETDLHSRWFFVSHIYPDNVIYQPWLSAFMVGIAAAALGAFNYSFLSKAIYSKYINWIFKIIIWIGLGFAIVVFISSFFLSKSFVYPWPAFLLVALIIYLLSIPFLIKQRNSTSYILLAGVSWIIIVLLPAQINTTFGLLENGDTILSSITNGPYLTFVALLGQIVIYTLGVGYRSNLVAQEKQRYEELDKMKSRFFTNISHEFRTPITLILGPLDKIKSKLSATEDLNLLNLAQDSAHNLLRLVNQVLDLSKLETNNVQLKVTQGDIVPFLKGIFYSFDSLAHQKNITQSFSSSEEHIKMYFDSYKMEGIFSNLLSNAFKFSDSGDTIAINIYESKKQVVIELSDTGKGISIENLPRIFDRFFQVDNTMIASDQGSGIGLALVKELVSLHHGQIEVDSEQGVGTTFQLSFPLGKRHFSDAEFGSIATPDLNISGGSKTDLVEELNDEPDLDSMVTLSDQAPTVLLIEDHKDVRSFIKSQLATNYNMIEAEDGNQGIERAIDTIPDLIVCDVMMPGKNGYEVCQFLKNDLRTSHIPIILLTAKAAREEKLEGLETGADDYLVKPFDTNELNTRIKNLIELRRKLRVRFSTSIQIKASEISANSMDQLFMEKALKTVEKHISNEDFSVLLMTEEMNMSATQLNRKLRSLIDQSTNQFINSVRLQRAADLLIQESGTVAEIAFQTGYRSPAYFISAFKKQFGMTPGAYKEQHIK